MELVSQYTKNIMEGCKERAKEAGLRFSPETLEYIVSNRDLLELTPKLMIPTLYDYWVHDVEVLREKGRYELYPSNPYETVVNTRPAISFYNDNNPDWLNVMIFYHVLAHIDFFQNNLYYRHTWDYDFNGQALSDKRLIAKLRSEKGRWVDYVIEFTRGIDNLVGYHAELAKLDRPPATEPSLRLDYYFDVFLQSVKKVKTSKFIKEIERYNESLRDGGEAGAEAFFAEVNRRYPEFEAMYRKSAEEKPSPRRDLMEYLLEESPFLGRNENKWMKSVIQVVRNTSLFFQPQIRTKIMNEGWASYWHERLFLKDDRINGNEVDFSRVHAQVTALPRAGLNPYALGMRLFQYIEDLGDKGKYSFDFKGITDVLQRGRFDRGIGKGRELIFDVRTHFCDFTFIHTFLDQDFVDRNRLFVVGRRLNSDRMVWEYFVKSRKAEAYRRMLVEQLYHPPWIEIDAGKSRDGELYLIHRFEEKPLVKEYLAGVLLGIEWLWGGAVHLETSEVAAPATPTDLAAPPAETPEPSWERVVYTMKDRKLSRRVLSA